MNDLECPFLFSLAGNRIRCFCRRVPCYLPAAEDSHHRILFLTFQRQSTHYVRVFTHLGLQHTWAYKHIRWSQSCSASDQVFPWSLGDSCLEIAPTYTDSRIESLGLQTTRVLVKYDLKPAPKHSLAPLWTLSLIFAPPIQLHGNHGRATGLSTSLPPLGFPPTLTIL